MYSSRKLSSLRAYASPRVRCLRAAPEERGYILLFTLGVLSVIAMLTLSVATAVRLEARSLADSKTKLQLEYALLGAVHHGLAQLGDSLSKVTKDSGQSRTDTSNKPNGPPKLVFDLGLNGFELRGVSQDASLLPDGNLLSKDEWIRLAKVLGADEAAAGVFAEAVLQEKKATELVTGKQGFRSIKEIVGSNTLSLPLMRGAFNSQGLSLTDLIVIGTQKKQLDINESALVMFKILANFSNPQLVRLDTLRSRGAVSDAETTQLLSGSGVQVRSEVSNFLRLKVENTGPIGVKSQGIVALIKREGDVFQVVDSSYIHRSLPLQ